MTDTPNRQIRAQYTDSTITVYQAYPSAIAEPSLAAGKFVPPFKLERMTWIKPSFLWMAYRSGWATKPGQEQVLAIEITRDGFEWALANSCLSHYEPEVHNSHEGWADSLRQSPVRIQWDPERNVRLERLDYRSIQIGLSGEAVTRYVNRWIVAITQVSDIHKRARLLVAAGDYEKACRLLPHETSYPLPDHLRRRIGAHPGSSD